MAIGNRPVEITQIYEPRGTSFITPRLVPVAIGVLKQKIKKALMGSYDGGGVSDSDTDLPFPSILKAGAQVESSSVKVYIDTKLKGHILIEDTNYDVTEEGLTLYPDIEVEYNLIDDGSGTAKIYKTGTQIILEDTKTSFIASHIYGNASKGDKATILGYDGVHTVKTIISANKVELALAVGSTLETAFTDRPDRIFTSMKYDIDRTVTVGDTTNLLPSGDIYISLDAIRTDKAGAVQYIRTKDDLDDLGPFSPDNEVGFASHIFNQSKDAVTAYVTLTEHSADEHNAALELLKTEEVYYLNPLTMDNSIINLYIGHVNAMSLPAEMKERVVYFSRILENNAVRALDDVGDITITSGTFFLENTIGNFQSNGVLPGDIVEFTDNVGSQDTSGKYTVTNVISETKLELFESVRNTQVTGTDGKIDRNGFTLTTSQNLAGVTTSSDVEITSGDDPGIYSISVVNSSAGTITIGNPPTEGFKSMTAGSFTIFKAATSTGGNDITYDITSSDFTRQEQAEYMKGLGESYGNQRARMIFSDSWQFDAPDLDDDGKAITSTFTVGGEFGASTIIAMRFARGPQVPMTGELIRHARTVFSSSQIFTMPQLQIIQSGGVIVVFPDENSTVPRIMQLLTTDVSDVTKQEVTIIEAVDFFAKYVRSNVRKFMGINNITPQVLNVAHMKMDALTKQVLEDHDGFGPLFGPKTELLSLKAATECPDTVEAEWDIDPLFPWNKTKIKFYV